ncbi:MAG: ParB/RepB/Spo0J family partition protein [Candidatus Saccharimonadales bacterium]
MSSHSSRGLGKGFESLLPTDFDNSVLLEPDERIQKLSVNSLSANPHQPRTTFDKQSLDELARSIKQFGVLQPLVVTPNGSDAYYIVAGERRWRASKLVGLQTVPAIVRSSKELDQLEIAIIENVQRVDLSPLEQAVSIQRLHEQFNLSYDTIAQRLGKANTTVANIVRLLGLPADARAALNDKKITEGHARAILALKNPRSQAELLDQIIKNGWSVRQAERFVTAHKQGVKDQIKASQRVQTSTPQTVALSQKLKTSVAIRRTAKGGKLEIGFKNDDELNRIIDRIN